MMDVTIRPESPIDEVAIRAVNEAAFHVADEADLIDQLRTHGHVACSLVAERDGLIVGHILFSRIMIHTQSGPVDALSLAPMAVIPELQRTGVGSRLVEAGLEHCREHGHRIVLVLGHPEFYPRFGFSAKLAQPLASPFAGGDAWMALELAPGALSGVTGTVQFSKPFGVFV